MGQGQDPQGHLLGVPFPEFPRGMSGLGDGCGDLGWGKLDNSAVTLFDLFYHGALLGCSVRCWLSETTKKFRYRHFSKACDTSGNFGFGVIPAPWTTRR
jgi:hypothetical protein